jgi:nucleotide-binding universal stress UspA family protein
MYEHTLIPTDGSRRSEMAVIQGVALAQSIVASVTAITRIG